MGFPWNLPLYYRLEWRSLYRRYLNVMYNYSAWCSTLYYSYVSPAVCQSPCQIKMEETVPFLDSVLAQLSGKGPNVNKVTPFQ